MEKEANFFLKFFKQRNSFSVSMCVFKAIVMDSIDICCGIYISIIIIPEINKGNCMDVNHASKKSLYL